MYVDEPPKDGNIPDFNISKIDICPFRAYKRSFRLFQCDFSKDIHQRSRLLCFTQNDHTGQTGFKICPFFKWGQLITYLVRSSSHILSFLLAYVFYFSWAARETTAIRVAMILGRSFSSTYIYRIRSVFVNCTFSFLSVVTFLLLDSDKKLLMLYPYHKSYT